MTDLDRLVRGSIDMHIHTGPDVVPRRVDVIEAAEQARQAGMRAIVVKNHHYPTAPIASLASRVAPGIGVFGSVCLDYEIGGLNHHALDTSAAMGARVVWMPTFSAINARSKARAMTGLPLEGEGYSLLDDGGRLVPAIDRILATILHHDMVLATGHISPAEIFALVSKARDMGLSKVVITHPLATGGSMEQVLTLEDQKRLAGMGAIIEHTYVMLLPNTSRQDPREVAEGIRAVGVEHCIITTDLGQNANPPPAEGMRMFMALLLRLGFTGEEIEAMAKLNPARLLGLD